ncbi:histone-lysine N-methyltransferase, H3 lysine-79 specific-like [Monomorium pharaonis]|uniref:histone-lysine N-methyltransferase, H3 lysine-79 specific-like n=1 Tax=Monomorium pharaonis TaxID=307658 RepID=UPI001746428F|nr:histone-lysine N-methyltransferase, H3 lysine-79 specific-like [Monomorium pharaonis]
MRKDMVVKKEAKSEKRNMEIREGRDRKKKVEDKKMESGELREIREELRGIREGIMDLVGLWRKWIEKEKGPGKGGEKRERKESRKKEKTKGQEEQGSTGKKKEKGEVKRRESEDRQRDSKEKREEKRIKKATEEEGGEVKERKIKGERRKEEVKSKERKPKGGDGVIDGEEKYKERRGEKNEVTEEMMEEWWKEVEAEEEREGNSGQAGGKEGEGGRWVLITEIVREADREEILARGGEVKGTWGVGVDEDLTMEERRMRWRIVEAARKERATGKKVIVSNRGFWVEERKWS